MEWGRASFYGRRNIPHFAHAQPIPISTPISNRPTIRCPLSSPPITMSASAPLRTAFLEIFEQDQKLIVRPPISHLLAGVIFFLMFQLVGWMLIYANFAYPSSDWQPMWEPTGPMRPWSQHSLGDQLATIAFLTFFCGAFIAGGFFALWMGLRHLRPWIIRRDADDGDHSRAGGFRLSRGRKTWTLPPTGNIRLNPTKMLGTHGIVMELDPAAPGDPGPTPLRFHSIFENKGISLTDAHEQMQQLAQRVGSFLGYTVTEQNLPPEGEAT